MSNQVTDIRRTVFGTFVINPKSTAGVLLREHDNVAQALAYAERKAKMLLAVHNPLGLDYAKAAEDLREEQKSQERALSAQPA